MDISVMHVVIAKTWGGGEQYVFDVCAEMKRQGIKCYRRFPYNASFFLLYYINITHIISFLFPVIHTTSNISSLYKRNDNST